MESTSLIGDLYLDHIDYHIDWDLVWRYQILQHINNPCNPLCEPIQAVSGSQKAFLPHGRVPQTGTVSQQIAMMDIKPGSRVLDIGAGLGNLSLALQKAGCSVTAIEPSVVMIEGMNINFRKNGVSGIRIQKSRWEEVDTLDIDEPFDAVIASFSLGITNIREAILKMDSICRGRIFIFWYMTLPVWARAVQELWPLVHDGELFFGPMADILYQVILKSGIFPNITMYKNDNKRCYVTLGEIVHDFHNRMQCSDDQQDAIIRRYMRTRASFDGKKYQLRGFSHDAMLWWHTNNDLKKS